MFFTATTSEKVVNFAKSIMNESIIFRNTDEDDEFATVEGLKHGLVLIMMSIVLAFVKIKQHCSIYY